jgi:MYXO-CTERM domain-containing protein
MKYAKQARAGVAWLGATAAVLGAGESQAGTEFSGRLFGSEVQEGEIIRIWPTNGFWSSTGPTNVGGFMTGLAYDEPGDALYGVNSQNDSLYLIDTATGSATLIGAMAMVNDAVGLAFNVNSGALYVSDLSERLFRVDPATAQAELVGEIGGGAYGDLEGLGYDPVNDVLYGISDDAQQFLAIDPATADAVALDVNLPDDQWRGLTFDPVSGVAYATSVTPSRLYRIDPLAGTTTFIDTLDGASAVQGLAYSSVPGPGAAWLAVVGLACGRRRRRG